MTGPSPAPLPAADTVTSVNPEGPPVHADVRFVRDIEDWTSRLGVFIISIVLFRLGFELWWVGRIHENVWVQLWVVLFYAGGLAFLFMSFLRMRHVKLHLVGFLTLLLALAFYAIVVLTVVNVHYTSDAMLFVHQAAAEFAAGNNPYTRDLIAGYDQFRVPYYVETPTTSGGQVSNLNYPALAFLVYVPFVLLGVPDIRPVSLAFLLALLTLFYLATPKHLRLLATSVLFLSSFFISFSISSVDIVFIYFLVAGAVLWERNKNWAMLFVGLAAATKQVVWFVVPFLLVALYMETRDRIPAVKWRKIGVASAWGAGAFLLPNLPFIVMDPGAWFRGVLTPFGLTQETLAPLSQGITVPFYTGLARFDPMLLHLAAGIVMLVLLGVYWMRYERLKHFAWVVPPFVLAFTERTLQNYYEMFYPVGILLLARLYPLADRHPAEESATPEAAGDDAAGPAAPAAGRPAGGVGGPLATAIVLPSSVTPRRDDRPSRLSARRPEE